MNEKKHIDRIFQEKFKHFEATPDDAVWDNIHDALHEKKKKRRIIPLWWLTAGVAAIVLLMLTVGNLFKGNSNLDLPTNHVVGTEAIQDSSESRKTVEFNKGNQNRQSKATNGITTKVSESDALKNDGNRQINNDAKKPVMQLAKNNHALNKNGNKITSSNNNTASQSETAISQSKENGTGGNAPTLAEVKNDEIREKISEGQIKALVDSDKESTQMANVNDREDTDDVDNFNVDNPLIIQNTIKENIEEAIAKANLINEEEEEEQLNRWNISPSVAPVYFNSLGKGSSIDNQFVNNDKNGAVNMSYGINGSYAINDKIKIRAGVNKVDLGYSTAGVTALRDVNSFNVNAKSGALRNINFNSQGNQNTYMSATSIHKASAPQFIVSNSEGSLEQQFGYIEVPLEMEYNLVDSKFGVNLIGGFSTLFLNNNELYSVLENHRSLLGDANNINTTSYSANLGLGLNYNISHTLKLNLEPMFKYQINTFNNTSGDFRPYFIGVYSGFSFKF